MKIASADLTDANALVYNNIKEFINYEESY